MLCCVVLFWLQLVAFMRKEEQLLSKYPGLDLASNLQQGSSAAAVTAVLGDTHTNASAAAAAAAAVGDAFGLAAVATAEATTAAENNTAKTQQVAAEPSVVSMAASDEAAAALASAMLESATSAVDPAFAGLSSLLSQLAKQASNALQHLATEHTTEQQQQEEEAGALSPQVLLAQLQALQQRLPGQDVARLLADYQAWLEKLKERLLQQDKQTQVQLHCCTTPLTCTVCHTYSTELLFLLLNNQSAGWQGPQLVQQAREH
jgi:hypothetical protein